LPGERNDETAERDRHLFRRRGYVIVALEGIDGSGKQTQVKLLKERLTGRFDRIDTFDFPHYQSIAGGLVGRILKGETVVSTNDQLVPALRHDHLPGLDLPRLHLEKLMASWSLDKALVIQCVMLADRLEHSRMLNAWVSQPHCLLILDRYYLSGLVYGQADGLDRDWLEKIHATLPRPDAFFLLDIPVEESVRRRPERRDYYEKNLPKLKKVRELYKSEISAVGGYVVDATRTVEEITTEIVDQVIGLKP
jgi:dTMP kinase